MSSYQSSNMTGEVWLQWFGCCINQPAQQRKRQAARRTRVRIDRSMIGNPTNFQHTGHIGSGDVQMGTSHLTAIQNQMQSKGGYETAFIVQNQPIDGIFTDVEQSKKHQSRPNEQSRQVLGSSVIDIKLDH